jgi:hypothetical protein
MRIALVTILLAACTTGVWVMIVFGGEAAQPGFHPDGLPPDGGALSCVTTMWRPAHCTTA